MDERKQCCQQAENLVPQQLDPDLIVAVCKVCGCRHFEFTVEPGTLGLKGPPL